MNPGADDIAEMTITDVSTGPPEGRFRPVVISTTRGTVDCRHYQVPGSSQAVVMVGGIGGGFDSPARGLYDRLGESLVQRGIAALRVRFRHPTELEEAVLDILAGVTYLQGEGARRLALVGHSFGGAVVIQAGALDEDVEGVVTLATQSYGAAPVSRLPGGCALLLIHGSSDRVLPPSSSQLVLKMAHEPKQLIVYQGAGHSLDEVAEEVYGTVLDWLADRLGEPGKV